MVLYRDHNYYHCEYCNSFHFPSVSTDGVRLFGEDPEGTRCPNCLLPLYLATLDNIYKGFQCRNCHGLLLKRDTFRRAVDSGRASATTPAYPPQPLNREELHRKLNCPICQKQMMTHPYLGPGTIVIDTCGHCNIIWLDYGELKHVINAPGKDRGKGLSQVLSRHDEEQQRNNQRKLKRKYEKDLLEFFDRIF
jgi:Zn-finger nucleic acid-binding protein